MTIKDIARASGYAVSTVSRALNDHPDVSPETKARIRRIVEESGFVPNTNARQLKKQQTNTIAVIIKGSMNLFFASLAEPMQNRLARAGCAAVVSFLREGEDELLAAERICREAKPLGVLFLGGNAEGFRERFGRWKLPAVLATVLAPELSFYNLSTVGIDDREAGAAAYAYLYERGHRVIGIIGGDPGESYISARRLEGCRLAAAERGAAFPEERFCRAPFSLAGGREAMRALLGRAPGMTAVFCMSDLLALGAMRAARETGLRVPEEMSVLGFDGIELGEYCKPVLSTVVQPAAEIVAQSVSILMGQIREGEQASHVVLPASFREGESVLPL